jgi:hypothetical protein
MRLLSIGFATATLLVAFTANTYAADGGAIRASCISKDGRVVYREDLPPGTPSDRRLQIAAKYRNALCAFLKTDPVEASTSNLRDPVITAVTGGGGNGDLAAALAYLSPGGDVGTPYGGHEFDEGMKSFMKSENAFTDHVRSVNLTIGVYSGATTEDVLGHWAYIKQNTTLLGRMTPSIEKVGDIVVLNVEDVADDDASAVCKEAETYASGCMAVY